MNNSRGVSRFDGGCHIVVSDKDGNIIEEKKRCDCNNCQYREQTKNCISQIFDAFTRPIIDKYLELRKDLSHDYIEKHPELLGS